MDRLGQSPEGADEWKVPKIPDADLVPSRPTSVPKPAEGWDSPDSEAGIHSDRERSEPTDPEKYPEPNPEEE